MIIVSGTYTVRSTGLSYKKDHQTTLDEAPKSPEEDGLPPFQLVDLREQLQDRENPQEKDQIAEAYFRDLQAEDCKKMHEICLDELGITCLPLSLARCTNVTVIQFSNNNLSDLQQQFTFFPVMPSVQVLKLRKCEITSLPEGFFAKFPNVRLVDLSRNPLESLDLDSAFEGHNQLEEARGDFNTSTKYLKTSTNCFVIINDTRLDQS